MSRFSHLKRAVNGVVGHSPEDVIEQAHRRYCDIHGSRVPVDEFKIWLADWRYQVVAEHNYYRLSSRGFA